MAAITCYFCKKILGSIKNIEEVDDARCDEHEIEFGSYTKMWEIFDREIQKDYNEFKVFADKSERKIDIFIKNCIIEYPNIFLTKELEKGIEEKRQEAEQSLGIDKLSYEEKLKKIADMTAS